MPRTIAFLCLVSFASAPAAAAGPDQYLGISVGAYEAEPPGASGERSETDVSMRLGYHFSDFVGVEGRLGANAANIAGDDNSGRPATEYAGLFLRLDLPFDRTNVYLLLGGAAVTFDGESVDSDEKDPVAGGLGIELYGSRDTAVVLEYMRYAEDSYQGIGLGLKHHFGMPSFR